MREAYEKFLAQYGKTRSLSSAFRKDFFEAVRMVSFREKDHWLISGIRNREVPYLLKGSAMGYIEEGREQLVVNLWQSGDTIVTGSTLLPRPNAGARIVFTEDIVAMTISLERIDALQQEHADARFLVAELLKRTILQMDRQYIMMVHRLPEERIAWLKRTYPETIQHLTLKQKASFLGISLSTYKRLESLAK